MYLRLMDSLHNIQIVKYAFIFYSNHSQADMIFELIINLISFLFGAAAIIYVWSFITAEDVK